MMRLSGEGTWYIRYGWVRTRMRDGETRLTGSVWAELGHFLGRCLRRGRRAFVFLLGNWPRSVCVLLAAI